MVLVSKRTDLRFQNINVPRILVKECVLSGHAWLAAMPQRQAGCPPDENALGLDVWDASAAQCPRITGLWHGSTGSHIVYQRLLSWGISDNLASGEPR